MHINRWIKWHPLSTLTSEVSSKVFGVFLIGGLFSFLMINVCLNLYVDPFFVFRRTPFESRHLHIDEQQRFAKSLQVITRQPKVVLLGSSRVYRGFDVEGEIYNMGVSSMTLIEASSYVKHILKFTSAQKIVLGLDFWMIDEIRPTQVGWDKKTGTISYTLKSFLRALFRGNEAFLTLKESICNNKSPPIEEKWNYDGFFYTNRRSKNEVDSMLLSYEQSFQKTQLQLEMLSYLEDIIRQCKIKKVKLYIYLSPLHPATKKVYQKSNNADYFDPWRKKVQLICEEDNIPFYDLSNMLNDSQPLDKGSTDIWLDYSHFSPKVGRKILQGFGLNY
jgi:hypothetical protein